MKPIVYQLKINEEGYALMAIMLVLFMLTIIGVSATTTSNIEVQISGNTKKIAEDFYDAEGAMITAIENTDLWLTDNFLATGEGAANWVNGLDFDGQAGDDALVEIRCITTATDGTGNPVTIAGLSTVANDLPVDRHITSPPSLYSVAKYTSRKYGVTSTALRNGETIGAPLQTGVWKAFNKEF